MAALSSGLLQVGNRLIGTRGTVVARCLLRGYPMPRWGSLRRIRPFSATFGFERRLPIDRFYLHRFFEPHRDLVQGDVLEVQRVGYDSLPAAPRMTAATRPAGSRRASKPGTTQRFVS